GLRCFSVCFNRFGCHCWLAQRCRTSTGGRTIRGARHTNLKNAMAEYERSTFPTRSLSTRVSVESRRRLRIDRANVAARARCICRSKYCEAPPAAFAAESEISHLVFHGRRAKSYRLVRPKAGAEQARRKAATQ